MTDELCTSKEAAAMLRVSPSTVTALRKRGQLAYVQIGRKVLYRKASVLKFIADREITVV